MLSEKLYSKPLPQIPSWLIWVIIAAGLVGFLDATYLTAEHYLEGPIPCSLLEGCEVVTTSKYATIFSLPISLFGAVYYLAVLILAFLFLDLKKTEFLWGIFALSTAGFLTSIFLLYLQIFVIEAFCLYCLISVTTSTLLFIASSIIFVKFRRSY